MLNFRSASRASDSQLYGLQDLIKKRYGRDDPMLFVFRDRDGGILFVQERVFNADGEKTDYPWSLWTHEVGWDNREPEGLLPLFGLDQRLENHYVIYIHEGAKTAQHLRWLNESSYESSEGLKAHPWLLECPWRNDLKMSAHIGWPGGAPNAHRVDWGPIKRLSVHKRIILVCDHDPAGENAAREISRELKRPMSVIRFGADFPRSFDLSDKFPETLFKEHKGARVYTGPMLEDCLEPATWATTAHTTLRPEFVEEWWYTIKPTKFIYRKRLNRSYSEEEFNAAMATFSDIENVASALRKYLSAKAETIIYDPSRTSGRISQGGAQVVNVFRPSDIRPLEKGEPQPFLDFIEYLIPDQNDREEMLHWIATLVVRQDIRMTYGPLLISITQGVGKTLLAQKILAPLVGRHNCSFPSASEVVEATYTGWLAFKRLVVVAEIYEGHSAKAYDRLKTLVTDEYVRVNEKYEKQYDIQNFAHFCASSNSFRALKLSDQDRRWFVPGITEEPRDLEYFQKLCTWLDDENGLPIIRHWANKYIDKHGPIPAGQHAPLSEAKRRAIEEGRSEGERIIATLAEEMNDAKKEKNQLVVLRLDEVRRWLAARKATIDHRRFGSDGNLRLELPEKISSIFRAFGLYLPTMRIKKGSERFRIAANFEVVDIDRWEDYYKRPDDLMPL
jgi:Family of unknown function (DUF5906)